MTSALVTDLYEVTMAVSYLRHGMDAPATFSLFARRLPPDRGFLVAAGLEDCLDFLAGLRFTADEVDYLREVLHLSADDASALAGLRFTGDAWAVPEGRLVFGDEPLLEVTAPIAEAQLAETLLLNRITFQTAVASKAARCRIAAAGRPLVDFSLRRTHGIDAGMQAARLSAMVGFAATSNVAAARDYGLTPVGTMAHSYVEAFPDEEQAFRTFAADFPERATLLVDTYDTVEGVRTAARVITEQRPSSPGVRLDSGDLGELAVRARQLLDGAGATGATVLVSGGLDEHAVAALVTAGAPVDAFAVGTLMGVSADAPYLDTAYKLVEYAGRPVAKLSAGKATLPGAKQVHRAPGVTDVLGLRDEPVPHGSEALLEPVMVAGHRTAGPEPLARARERFERDLAQLPEAALRLRAPHAPGPR